MSVVCLGDLYCVSIGYLGFVLLAQETVATRPESYLHQESDSHLL